MSGLLAGSYIIFGGTILASIGFTWAFCRYYEDKYDRERVATWTAVVAISSCLGIVALLPVDVLLVNSTTDNATGLKRDWATPDVVGGLQMHVKVLYIVSDLLVLLMTTMVVPFVYFYYEAFDEDEVNQAPRARALSALKYATFSFAVTFLLAILSLFVGLRDRNENIDLGWFERLATIQGAEKILFFLLGALSLAGTVVLVTYTAFGLSFLPLSMIKGRGIPPQEVADVERELATVREQIRAISAKYPAGRRPQGRDLKQLQEFQRNERLLIRRQRIIEESTTGFWSYVLSFIRPIEMILGFLGMALTLTMVFSMALTLIDRLANTFCSSCGFLIDQQRIPNPLNTILLRTSRFFPVDLVFFGIVILWFFLSTAAGIVRIGIRVLWVNIFSVKKGSTAPQGLLCMSVLLLLSLVGMNYSVTILAPQYSSFGNQYYCNHTVIDAVANVTIRDCSEHKELIVPCSLSAPAEICTPTVLSLAITSVTYNSPPMGFLLYVAQWVFIGAFVIGMAVALVKRVRRGDWDLDDEDELESEEQEGLLASSSRGLVEDATDAVRGTARRALFGSWFG